MPEHKDINEWMMYAIVKVGKEKSVAVSMYATQSQGIEKRESF